MYNNYRIIAIDECLSAMPPLMGRSCFEWLKTTLNIDAVCTELPATLESDSIILYDDTPLVDNAALDRAITRLEAQGAEGADLGRGYILKKGRVKLNKLEKIDDKAFVRYNCSTFPSIVAVLKQRINTKLVNSGVFIYDMTSTYIDDTVTIEAGATIYPNNTILGDSVIRKGAIIKPNSFIDNSVVGECATIMSSTLIESEIGALTNVGPYAYLRPNCNIGSGCKIGDFVEIKNSNIGDGTKVPHLAYVGDADVGKGINIGCGVIFANYDGRNKHRSVVGDGTFVGSNTTLIAPITVGTRAFIAAGATLVHDVPSGSLVIARATETIKEGRAEQYLKPQTDK